MTHHIQVQRQGAALAISFDGQPLQPRSMVVTSIRLRDEPGQLSPQLVVVFAAERITVDASIEEVDDEQTVDQTTQETAG